MSRHRHSPTQKVQLLRRADEMLARGETVASVAAALGVSEATFHRWRGQYGGMKADDAVRLAELERENRDLRNTVANQCLDILMLRQLTQARIVTPQMRSAAVQVLRDGFGVSERRACSVVGQPRTSERRLAGSGWREGISAGMGATG